MLNKVISSIVLITLASNCWGMSLQDNGDGTVSDFDTGLLWQQQDDNSQRTWGSAVGYCNGLTLAGKTDWRLPEVKELVSIVDYRVYFLSIDNTFFQGTNATFYWSASSFASDSADAWSVSFTDGSIRANIKTSSQYVRCVS